MDQHGVPELEARERLAVKPSAGHCFSVFVIAYLGRLRLWSKKPFEQRLERNVMRCRLFLRSCLSNVSFVLMHLDNSAPIVDRESVY